MSAVRLWLGSVFMAFFLDFVPFLILIIDDSNPIIIMRENETKLRFRIGHLLPAMRTARYQHHIECFPFRTRASELNAD